MKQGLLLLLSLGYCTLSQGFLLTAATAQVTPDGTTHTRVDVSGNDFTIEQGDRAGGNLFHSFSDFSVPTDGSAFFNNAADIVNIFSRVTGGNISNIDGLLRANGAANLFLINPAGIILGEGARLDIGGSFYGSTADSIVFSNGEFSATDLANPPLITINAPIGLNFRDHPGEIVNRSVADDVGLEVETGKGLALVGGNISLEGGILTASEGNIELGAVAGNSIVNLEENSSGFDFQYDGITNFGNIELTQEAILDSSGEGSGGINLQGNQISLQDGSQVRAQTLGSVSGKAISVNAQTLFIGDRASISSTTIGEGDAGEINIEASESIEIVGTGFEEFGQIFIAGNILGTFNLESLASGTGIFTGTTGTGTGGNINLEASNLSLQEGGGIGNFTLGEGAAGNLTINAAESIEVISSGILNVPSLGSTGNGGRSDIKTTDLTFSDGGLISSSTLGAGNGGDILIDAAGQIEILRSPSNSLVPAGIFTNSFFGQGKSGDINISAQKLKLQDGGEIVSVSGANTRAGLLTQGGAGGNIKIIVADSIELEGRSTDNVYTTRISSGTYTTANAGDLNIETKNLIVNNGATIDASTINNGQGGNLTINATESIIVSGTSVDNQFSSSILSASGEVNFPLEFDSTAATGNAGSLSITTGNLSISDNGRVAANSLGSGDAGILSIRANDIQLENRGQIVAETAAGAGGNITLDMDERLTLRNHSLISAKAEANANGGNIGIDTDFIVAFPNQNNDILASAEQGRGGNINITAEALFGIEEIPQNPITNDIDASSEFGLDGTIAILTPDVNPLQRDAEVPINLIESEQTVAQACQSNRSSDKPSGLIVKGKGGFPPEPTEPFTAETILVDETITTRNLQARYPEIQPIKTSMGDIYPARGIIKTVDGKIILTAYATDHLNTRTPHLSANCNLRKIQEDN